MPDDESSPSTTASAAAVASSASVLLLCGLPASGKSTLARRLVEEARAGAGASGSYDDVVLIDYDAVEREILAELTMAEASGGVVDAASAASDCNPSANGTDAGPGDVGGSVDVPGGNSRPDSESDADGTHPHFGPLHLRAWRRSRRVALDRLDGALRSHLSGEDGDEGGDRDGGGGGRLVGGSGGRRRSLLVVLDDNFHLRSMRRDAHRVCQRHVAAAADRDQGGDDGDDQSPRIGFCVVMVDVPSSTCLERNSRRSGSDRVPDAVIRNMSTSFERPDPHRSDAASSFERASVAVHPAGREHGWPTTRDLGAVRDLLTTALDRYPVSPPKMEDPAAVEREREITRTNAVHRADATLRRLVGIACGIDRSLGGRANGARRAVLQEVRSGARGGGTGAEEDGDATMGPVDVLDRFVTLLTTGEARGPAGGMGAGDHPSSLASRVTDEFVRSGLLVDW